MGTGVLLSSCFTTREPEAIGLWSHSAPGGGAGSTAGLEHELVGRADSFVDGSGVPVARQQYRSIGETSLLLLTSPDQIGEVWAAPA